MNNASNSYLDVDVVVVGGGPAGATAAYELAQAGVRVCLIDREGRTKPCGGAVPPQLLKDFDVPRHVLEKEVDCARMVSPTERSVDMPIETGFVGMVDRAFFDNWLRDRAEQAGAIRVAGTYLAMETLGEVDGHNRVSVTYKVGKKSELPRQGPVPVQTVRAKYVIGADGAKSKVGLQHVPGADKLKSVFAYHEIIETPAEWEGHAIASRCDVIYDGALSPDFYSWVFPHGETLSVGTGTAKQGFSLRQSITDLRARTGLDTAKTLRTEGAPIPMKPLKRWDDGKHVLLCGDAAGCVAPASGEGIFYAMACGRMSAETMMEVLQSNDPTLLRNARKRFLKAHGKVFWALGIMQYFWYHSDKRRERFVTMCDDKDVQRLTWDSYLNKRLTRKEPMAHIKIFFKDMAHLFGIGPARG